jgi:hypothetical protein
VNLCRLIDLCICAIAAQSASYPRLDCLAVHEYHVPLESPPQSLPPDAPPVIITTVRVASGVAAFVASSAIVEYISIQRRFFEGAALNPHPSIELLSTFRISINPNESFSGFVYFVIVKVVLMVRVRRLRRCSKQYAATVASQSLLCSSRLLLQWEPFDSSVYRVCDARTEEIFYCARADGHLSVTTLKMALQFL